MSEVIILDGVNVAECRHLSFVEGDYCCDCQYEKYAPCQSSDCYYKQFKRLQTENDGLKSQLDFEIQKREVLKQENEELKIKNQDRLCYNLRLQKENEELKEENEWLKKQNEQSEYELKNCQLFGEAYINKYKQALEEIKEIIINETTLACGYSKSDEDVLNKINEVLG